MVEDRREREVSRGDLLSVEQRFKSTQYRRFGDVFHASMIADVSMGREAKSILPRLGWPEEADAGNSEKVRCMKHAGIHAEEQVAFLKHGERVGQRQAARVNNPICEFFEPPLRFVSVQDENCKV